MQIFVKLTIFNDVFNFSDDNQIPGKIINFTKTNSGKSNFRGKKILEIKIFFKKTILTIIYFPKF